MRGKNGNLRGKTSDESSPVRYRDPTSTIERCVNKIESGWWMVESGKWKRTLKDRGMTVIVREDHTIAPSFIKSRPSGLYKF